MSMPLYIFHEGGGREKSAPYNAFNMEVFTHTLPPQSALQAIMMLHEQDV